MSRIRNAEAKKYGELKKPFQFYLTQSTSNQIDKTSERLNLSRSEVLEMYIRGVMN